MSALLTKIINMKENYEPLLTLWFLPGVKISSYSKKFSQFSLSLDFWIFFHSVKKVSVQYFLWDHVCIKEDFGYFDKDVVLDSFLQGKTFCFYFHLYDL